jgi:hypothetical protein
MLDRGQRRSSRHASNATLELDLVSPRTSAWRVTPARCFGRATDHARVGRGRVGARHGSRQRRCAASTTLWRRFRWGNAVTWSNNGATAARRHRSGGDRACRTGPATMAFVAPSSPHGSASPSSRRPRRAGWPRSRASGRSPRGRQKRAACVPRRRRSTSATRKTPRSTMRGSPPRAPPCTHGRIAQPSALVTRRRDGQHDGIARRRGVALPLPALARATPVTRVAAAPLACESRDRSRSPRRRLQACSVQAPRARSLPEPRSAWFRPRPRPRSSSQRATQYCSRRG